MPRACRAPLVVHCVHCEEEIRPEDEFETYVNKVLSHRECFLRAIFGSVAHQEGRCGCYIPGSTASDDRTLTKREAARAAVRYYKEHHPEPLDSARRLRGN